MNPRTTADELRTLTGALSPRGEIARRVSPVVAIGATVALVFVGGGLLVATLFAPSGRDANVITGFVVSIVGPTVLALLTLIRADHASKLGASNARKLDATVATVEQVARDVNGHLTRHDTLASQVLRVATTMEKAAAGYGTAVRDPQVRTREDDPAPVEPPPAVTPPLTDQT